MAKVQQQMEPIAIKMAEAVRLTGISRSQFYREMRAGNLKARKRGATLLIMMEDLREFLTRQPIADMERPKAAEPVKRKPLRKRGVSPILNPIWDH